MLALEVGFAYFLIVFLGTKLIYDSSDVIVGIAIGVSCLWVILLYGESIFLNISLASTSSGTDASDF